jgi:hypothetical protein
MTDEKIPKLKEAEAKNSTDKQEGVPADPELEKSREAMSDKLDQPGALEVAEMPESDELAARRGKMRDKIQESSAVEELTDDPFDEDAGFTDMLKDANLSTRHFKFCCSGIVVVIIFVGLIFGGFKLVDLLQDRSDKIDEPDIIDENPDLDIEDLDVDVTIESGLLVGSDEAEKDFGVLTGRDIGAELIADDGLAKKISDFSRMYESTKVDVNDLLDKSYERRATLSDYYDELAELLELGRANLDDLLTESGQLAGRISATEVKKSTLEAEFFQNMNRLDSYSTTVSLRDFIDEGQESVRLKAENKARLSLIEFYDELVVLMAAKLRDIDLNEEALVKGIKIVDVEGSDIDLIIDDIEL